jgi:hypothetical protein
MRYLRYRPWLPVLLVVGLSVSLQIQPSAAERPREDHTHTGDDKQAPANTSNNPSHNVVDTSDSKGIPHSREQNEDPDKVEERREKKAQARLNSIYVLATVVGVIGGWVVLGVLIWQTILTKRSANAAKMSADALIHGERAWLLIDDVEQPFLVPPESQVNTQQPQLAHCFFYFKNFGKTPAKMIAWRAELQIGESADKPSMETAFDVSSEGFGPAMIPPGDPMPEEARLVSGFITAQQLSDITVQKTRFLWLCGIIKYEDVFRGDVEHVTTFCYLYETRLNTLTPLWRIAGLSERNKAT